MALRKEDKKHLYKASRLHLSPHGLLDFEKNNL